MAKQKGIHQIKGKVGDMSYYQSAGVPGGLIRRIPEGLSSRVKTADEYANTRLNNDEFKNAAAIATFAFRAVPSRKASMMRRFAVAEMIKEALQYIKEGTGSWGVRIPSATFDSILVDLLENHSKNGPYAGEFGEVVVSTNQGAITITWNYSAETAARLLSQGIDGIYTVITNGAMAESVNTDGFVVPFFGASSPNPDDATIDPEGNTNVLATFTPSASALGLLPLSYTGAQAAANNGMFSIVTFLPYRLIGSQRHVLYEYATFVAIPLGAIPSA